MGTTYKVFDDEQLCLEIDEMSNLFTLDATHKEGCTYESKRMPTNDLWKLAFKIAQVASYWDHDSLEHFITMCKTEL